MLFERADRFGQSESIDGNSKKTRRPGRANVQVLIEKIGKTVSQIIDSDKEHRLKLQSLDMLHVKDSNVVVPSDALPTDAGDSSEAAICKGRVEFSCKRLDFFLHVHQDGDRWHIPCKALDFTESTRRPNQPQPYMHALVHARSLIYGA